MKKGLLLFLMILILFSFTLYSKEVKAIDGKVIFIANKSVVENQLTKKEIQKIFLGKKKKWKDHSNILFVVPDNDKILLPALKIIKKSKSRFENVWKKLIFTGKRKSPVKLKTKEEIIKFVSEHEGAFSVIPKSDIKEKDVKIIKVIEK